MCTKACEQPAVAKAMGTAGGPDEMLLLSTGFADEVWTIQSPTRPSAVFVSELLHSQYLLQVPSRATL